MDHMRQAIASTISQKIVLKNVSKRWLSDETGIPRTTLERGLRAIRPFNVEELQLIATALGIGLSELIQPALESKLAA